MKRFAVFDERQGYPVFFFFLLLSASLSFALQITSISQNTLTVSQFDKFEATFVLDESFTNPFDPAIIDVSIVLTLPNQSQVTVPAFYYKQYLVTGTNPEQYSNPGPEQWKIRYTPVLTGSYSYDIVICTAGQSALQVSNAGSFNCIESTNKGFIRQDPADAFCLRYENGDPRHNIGHNVCWVSGGLSGWQYYLSMMHDTGQNWTRIWMCPWNGSAGGMAIEWKKSTATTGYFNGVGNYSLQVAQRIDSVMQMAQDYGIAIQMVFQYHGQFSTQVNPNWDSNPYNIANASTDGGFLSAPEDFFTDAEAIRLTKNKYRYIIARWGYSPAILAWELWNEVQFTDAWHLDIDRAAVAAWHQEMSDYIRSIDPHRHLITTSSNEAEFSTTWNLPSIDLIQVHSYSAPVTRPFENIVTSLQQTYGKPVIIGEFGAGSVNGLNSETNVSSLPEPYQTQMNEALVLHNGIWSSLLSKSSAHLWWWDSYVYLHNDQFVPLADFVDGEDFSRLQKADKAVDIVETYYAAPQITDWYAQSTQKIFYLTDGIFPGMENLSKYLHGSWQTDKKSDPTFNLLMEEDGSLVIHVAKVSSSGTNSLKVLVNSVQVFYSTYTNGSSNFQISVPLSAGQQAVQIRNTGQDWFEITSYEFKPDGQYFLDSMGLSDSSRAFIWIYDVDSEYGLAGNGTFVQQPAFVKGLNDGPYDIMVYPTWPQGGSVQTLHGQSSGGILPFVLPDFSKDIAVKVKPACIVDVDDLMALAGHWLKTGDAINTDFNNDDVINNDDFQLMANNWLGFCPSGWPLD